MWFNYTLASLNTSYLMLGHLYFSLLEIIKDLIYCYRSSFLEGDENLGHALVLLLS